MRTLKAIILSTAFALFHGGTALAQVGAPTVPTTPVSMDTMIPAPEGDETASILDLGEGNGGQFLAYSEKQDKLRLYRRNGKALDTVAEIGVSATPWRAAMLTVDGVQRIAVAFGYGRKNLQAPLTVVLYDGQLKNPETVFALPGERTETTFLQRSDEGLFIVFFESKYFTKLGTLAPSGSGPGPWTFKELSKIRLGSKIDKGPAGILVGRPYGDIQGQDGDILLIKDSQTTLLPSYRGVSSAAFWPGTDATHPSILIGDGWHQNYGSFAQGKLSLLEWNDKLKTYALSLLDWDKTQYAFFDLKVIGNGASQRILASGSSSIFLYRAGETWSKQVLATQSNAMQMLSVIFLEEKDGQLWFVISDASMRVVGIKV